MSLASVSPLRVLVSSFAFAAVLFAGTRCQVPDRPASASLPDSLVVSEAVVRPISLSAPLDDAEAEVSGLTWFGDTLIVLPQYPARFSGGLPRALYGIARSDLQRALSDASSASVTPFRVELKADGLADSTHPYQGCEAIAFDDDRAYVLVESHTFTGRMQAFLLGGQVSPQLAPVHLDTSAPVLIEAQTDLDNMAYEALTVWGDTIVALYEANGANVNPTPYALRFGRDLTRLDSVRMSTLEYRITDATAVDASGRFWVTNYLYAGERDKLDPAPDSVMIERGVGASHRGASVVERLVELRITPSGIVRTDAAPVWLTLAGGTGRNWEGVARFGDGFLIATDRFPTTLLAYVEPPRPTTAAVQK